MMVATTQPQIFLQLTSNLRVSERAKEQQQSSFLLSYQPNLTVTPEQLLSVRTAPPAP